MRLLVDGGPQWSPALVTVQHSCAHDDRCLITTKSAAMLTIRVGPFQFVRHYLLKEAD